MARMRKSMRKKKRFYKKRTYKRRSKINSTITVKLRGTATVASDGSGVVSVYMSDNAPNAWLNGAGTLSDWVSYSALYDAYRVSCISVKYIPTYVSNVSTVSFAPMYIVHDPDDNTGAIATSVAVDYQNLRIKNLARPWTYFTRNPKRRVGGQSVTTTIAPGWFDIASPVYGGTLSFYASGLTNSNTYGTFIVTYYIRFTVRR